MRAGAAGRTHPWRLTCDAPTPRPPRISRRSFLTTAAALAGAASTTRRAGKRPPRTATGVCLGSRGACDRRGGRARRRQYPGGRRRPVRRSSRSVTATSRTRPSRSPSTPMPGGIVTGAACSMRKRASMRCSWRLPITRTPSCRSQRCSSGKHVLLREAACAQHLGSAADGPGGNRIPGGDADGHAGTRVRRHAARRRSAAGRADW